MDDVFIPLFLLEPLLDLGPGLVALADVQPVTAGTLGALGGDDLHNVAVAQLGVNVRDAVVDLGAHHGVAHAGVNGIGKIDGGGAGGQGYNPALGGEDEHLVVEHIDFQGLHIFFRVGILLALQQTAHPFKVLFGAGTGALLVFPVGGDAVFGGLVHLPGADLHLEGDALRADDGGVQTLVHIGLGGGDVILEPAGNQIKEVVNMAQHIVAVRDGVHNDPEGVDVVQLVHGLALGLHLAVDGVNVLDAAVGLVVNAHALQPLGDFLLNGAHEHLVLLFVGIEVVHNFVVGIRGQIPKGNVLQLPLNALHT